jgi:glycosyltransferase involved in cell wall biosynthesis
MAPTVSVVIPLRRGAEVAPETTARLAADAAVAEVLPVADDGAGPNDARQRGCEQASGEVVLLLDADVIPGPGLAAGHAAHHAARTGVVVVGAMPVPAPAEATARLYADAYGKWLRDVAADPAVVLRRLWGGNVSLRREDALRVGLDEPAMHGRRHEDRELGLRLAAAGLQGVFDPSLAAEHRYHRDLASFCADCRAEGAGRMALHRLHPELGPAEVPRGLRAVARPGVAMALIAVVRLGGPLAAGRALRRVEIARGMALEAAGG